MKKKIVKRIRNIASQLPASIEEESGIGNFKRIRKGSINHTRRLKRAYENDGINGINQYIKDFFVQHQKMVAKYPEMFKKRENGTT